MSALSLRVRSTFLSIREYWRSQKQEVCTTFAMIIFIVFLSTLQKEETFPEISFHEAANVSRTSMDNYSTSVEEPKMKKILYWHELHWIDEFGLGSGHQLFVDMACKSTNCEIVSRKDREPDIPHEEFDAIIFYAMDSFFGTTFMDRPKKRLPHQRYVFFMIEPPAYIVMNYKKFENFFNWTYTYRRDADIFYPYGRIGNKTTPYEDNIPDASPRTWLQPTPVEETVPGFVYRKTKIAAWFVSACRQESKRDEYIEELARHIDIDIYGSCGTNFCTMFDDKCTEFLDETYKFYIAFENSLCKDYISEKFFRTLNINVVPIVYGLGDYRDAAPPMSYIDILDYESPAHLAEYLLFLDQNPEEYAKYFWWKKHYEFYSGQRVSLCELCVKLNDPTMPAKVYADIDDWWTGDKCRKTNDILEKNRDQWILGEERRYFNFFQGNFH